MMKTKLALQEPKWLVYPKLSNNYFERELSLKFDANNRDYAAKVYIIIILNESYHQSSMLTTGTMQQKFK